VPLAAGPPVWAGWPIWFTLLLAGVEVGGDEFRRIQFVPLDADNSSTPSHRFANEMDHPALANWGLYAHMIAGPHGW